MYIQVPPKTSKRRRRRPARLAEHDGLEATAEATAIETDIEGSAPQPEATTTNSTSKPKRKRGDRKGNQYHDKAIYVVTEVGPAGEIIEPKKIRARFRNAIGVLVREKLNPAIRTWKDVPILLKEDLWKEKLKINFRFPEGTHELVKCNAFKIMAQAFCCWKSDLNKEYVQKGLTPFNEFGHITPNQWASFVAWKTSPEALALSASNSERAKMNKHPTHLGPGGYAGKEEVFRKMDEEAEASGKLPVKVLKKRSRNWIYARSTETSGSELKFAKPETEEAVSRILKYAEDKEKGLFTPSRERDELSLGLGNSEHPGRTRGIGKQMTWKHGFQEDSDMYKKHNRDLESKLEVQVKALVAKALQEQGRTTEVPTLMAPAGELALVGSPPEVPSSQGSTAAATPVDFIREATSCTLGVLIGRQHTMMEVGTGKAHPPGGLWHGRKIPQDYTRVEVHTVKPEFMTWKIDYPTPEGLELLGDVMNQFILWHKRDIILTRSSPPPPDLHVETVVEDGEIFSPGRGPNMVEMPHSPTPSEHVHDMAMPSQAGEHVPDKTVPSEVSSEHVPEKTMPSQPPVKHVPDKPMPSQPPVEHMPDKPRHEEHRHEDMPQSPQQAQPIQEQQAPPEDHGREGEDVCEWELRNKHPIKIRSTLVSMKDVTTTAKWFAHDQFKPENQVKQVPAHASTGAVTSKLHKAAKKYPNVEEIKWSKKCPKVYERGMPFLPNRVIQLMPVGMKKFHDWYLRVVPTSLKLIQAVVPPGTFGSPATAIAFDFSDIQTCFHLGEMEMNLVRTWCL